MKKMNNKGFTLIELLAVIVILAVLILMAMPSVLSLMERAQKNAFKTEVQEILKVAETVYADRVMSKGQVLNGSYALNADASVKKPTKYTCITLNELSAKGYMSKNFSSSGYSGFIEVFLPSDDTGTYLPVYGITITNGAYSLIAATRERLDNLDLDKMGGITKITIKNESTTCGAGKGTVNSPIFTYAQYKSTPAAADSFLPTNATTKVTFE